MGHYECGYCGQCDCDNNCPSNTPHPTPSLADSELCHKIRAEIRHELNGNPEILKSYNDGSYTQKAWLQTIINIVRRTHTAAPVGQVKGENERAADKGVETMADAIMVAHRKWISVTTPHISEEYARNLAGAAYRALLKAQAGGGNEP